MIPWFAIPANAGDVSGTVIDDVGSAVQGATVVVYDPRLNYAVAETNETGGWALVDLPDNPYRVRVLPPQDRNLTERWAEGAHDLCSGAVYDLGEASGIEIPLSPGAVVTGVLTDPDGVAVEGAVVKSRSTLPSPSASQRVATTDGDGRFTVQGLSLEGALSATFRFEVEHELYPDQYLDGSGSAVLGISQGEMFEVTPAAPADLGAHALLPGIVVRGTVTGPEGPLSKGKVSVYSPSEIRTDQLADDGTYEIVGLPPGNVLVWVTSDGMATTYFPDADRPGERVDVQSGEISMDVAAPFESVLRGQLLGGGDLSSVSVLLYNSDRTVGFSGDVEEDGSFEIEGLHGGLYTLQVTASSAGYLDGVVTSSTGGDRVFELPEEGELEVTVELSPAAEVHGVVRDRYTGEPVYGATVYAESRATGALVAALTDRRGKYVVRGLTGEDWLLATEYGPYCEGDPDWVSLYYPDAVNDRLGGAVALAVGESFEWNPLVPPDGDHDGMDDVWEVEVGLDPTANDGDEDPDGDGFTNREEYLLGTDPLFAVTDSGCGCSGGDAGMAAVLIPLLAWRRPRQPCPRNPQPSHEPGGVVASISSRVRVDVA